MSATEDNTVPATHLRNRIAFRFRSNPDLGGNLACALNSSPRALLAQRGKSGPLGEGCDRDGGGKRWTTVGDGEVLLHTLGSWVQRPSCGTYREQRQGCLRLGSKAHLQRPRDVLVPALLGARGKSLAQPYVPGSQSSVIWWKPHASAEEGSLCAACSRSHSTPGRPVHSQSHTHIAVFRGALHPTRTNASRRGRKSRMVNAPRWKCQLIVSSLGIQSKRPSSCRALVPSIWAPFLKRAFI